MRTDFQNIADGDRVKLFPNASNPLHKHPVVAMYQSGYFYCNGSDPMDGPDYYLGDVQAFNFAFELCQ